MFSITCRTLHLLVNNTRVTTINSFSQLGFSQNSVLFTVKPFSSWPLNIEKKPLTVEVDEQNPKEHSFTASYLINFCGFSSESAYSAAKYLVLKTSDKPDAVLNMLRDCGFPHAHICKLIRKCPQLLLACPEKTLLPKIEFLRSIGVPSSEIGRMVAWNPKLLTRKLENYIMPCYDVLKSVLVCDEKVIKALRRSSMVVMHQLPLNLTTNVAFLKELGMLESVISLLVSTQPMIVSKEPDKFNQDVRKAIEIGFDPSQFKFVIALQVISHMTQKTWEHKMDVYRRWGLSEDEIWSGFKKYPRFMTLSEKKIMDTMDVLVNKMGWQPAVVARSPNVLCYSLEKRIVPRCMVTRTLLFKGLLEGEISVTTILNSPEKYFLDSFVMKYQQEVPHLLSIFQGETSIKELGIRFDEKYEAKNL